MTKEQGHSPTLELIRNPDFSWVEQGQIPSSKTPLSRWFATREFAATQLAATDSRFTKLVGKDGLLQDFVFDLIIPKAPEANGINPVQTLSQADIYLTTAHGWAGRKEVMGVLPYLIILFSKYRAVGINLTLPGFGPSGFKEGVHDSWRTPRAIDALLLEALEIMGIEKPPLGKVAIHAAHSMGPITFLSDRYPLLRDPQHGHILLDPAFAEVSYLHRLVSYLGLGNAARLLGLPGVKRAFAPQIAKTVARRWGGPHTTLEIEKGHLQTIMETDLRTIVHTLLALANERPLEAARQNGSLEGTNVLAFIAGHDGFTPDKPAIEGLIAAKLEREKIAHLEDASHYSFGLETPQPPEEVPLTQADLRAWVLEQAQRDPDLARVVDIAQRTAQFMDEIFTHYQEGVKV